MYDRRWYHFLCIFMWVTQQNVILHTTQINMCITVNNWMPIMYRLLFEMNQTKIISIFSLMKSSKKFFIFLPAFYLIMCLMKSPKNFEKTVISKVWQLVSFWGAKTHFGEISLKKCIFRIFFFTFTNVAPLTVIVLTKCCDFLRHIIR